MNTLISLYNKNIESKNNNDFISSDTFIDICSHLVRAKDNLPRLNNEKIIAFFLKFLMELGLSKKNIEIKWYLSLLPILESDETLMDRVNNDIKWWLDLINRRVGFQNVGMTLVLSKNNQEYKNLILFTLPIEIRDEAKFLAYGKRGNISIHILKTKFSERATSNNKFKGYRSKTFISFLRLLGIHYRHRESFDLMKN